MRIEGRGGENVGKAATVGSAEKNKFLHFLQSRNSLIREGKSWQK